MSLQVVWSGTGRASLRKLDPPVAREVSEAVVRFAEEGAGDVARLRPPETGYRLRVRDWRVFMEIDRDAGTLAVIRVEHRSKAYKRR